MDKTLRGNREQLGKWLISGNVTMHQQLPQQGTVNGTHQKDSVSESQGLNKA